MVRPITAAVRSSAKGDASLDITRGRCPSKTGPERPRPSLRLRAHDPEQPHDNSNRVALLADSCHLKHDARASAFIGWPPEVIVRLFSWAEEGAMLAQVVFHIAAGG